MFDIKKVRESMFLENNSPEELEKTLHNKIKNYGKP